MGLNKPFNRHFFLIDGAVKTSGGSINLAKGQVAAVDQAKSTKDGLKVINSFAGKPKDKKDFTLRLGIDGKVPGRSYTDKSYSTVPFSLDEIVGLEVSAPKTTEHVVDELILGYDGTPGSEFNFKTGDSYFRIALELKGGSIQYRGGSGDCEYVGVNIDIPHCDPFEDCVDCDGCAAVDCKVIVEEAVARLKRKQLTGGKALEEFIDITPVFECDNAVSATMIPYDYYELDVCDTGDSSAKAIVEAQYDAPVIRTNRVGSTSTYQVLLPRTEGAPADFDQTIASIIKGCEDCPAGYSEVAGGFVYAFTIDDGGSDQSALITALTNYVAGTVIKSGNSGSVGFYTAVFSAEITDAQITAFLGGAAPRATATIDLVGEVSSICSNATTTSTAWVLGDTCNAVEEEYTIWLPDNNCGENRLAELQSAFPDLTIAVAQEDSVNSTRDITLTGTSGDANINIGGVDYLATFNTDLTTTASDFITAHAANILAASGAVVTAALGVITIVGLTADVAATTITVDTADLAGTLGAASVILQDVVGGCQTKYTTTVVSNLVCDECNDIFKDAYLTDAPESYDIIDWTREANATTSPSGNCKCGIRFKSKVFVLDGDEALRDMVGFTETSVQIQASAGFPDEIREGIGRLPKGGIQGKYLSRQIHRTHLGGNLRHLEAESKAYFRNTANTKGYMERVLRGEESSIQDSMTQYIGYTLKISSFNHAQGFAGRINDDIDYTFHVEVGKHSEIENLLNNLVSAAGKSPVKAFGA